MIVHMSLGTLIMLVIAGITYGIIMAIRDLLPHATPVHPKHINLTSINKTSNQYVIEFSPMGNRTLNEEDLQKLVYNTTLGTSAFPRPKPDVPPQCVDPTFACQDLKSAKLCDVVKDCVHDVWETMSVPDVNDEVCDICKEMVKEARDQLLSNMTQEELKEVFEGSCKLLPIKLIADGCIKVVDEIIPQLVEMLASRMDPTMVCTVSGMCYATHSTELSELAKLFKMILDQSQADQCTECTTMLNDVKAFLGSASEADVKKYIENFCDEKVPSYLCDILVDSYLPTLYTYIVKTDAKTLCSSAGVCPKVCKPKKTQSVNDELTCEFCEHVLQHVKDLVTANTTAEEFRTALLNFCNHTGKFADKCTAMVDDYYDMLFDYIRKLDTKGMCTLIGLCNSEKCSGMPLIKLIPAAEAKKRVSMVKLQPATRISNEMPLVKLIPAEVANKRQGAETNDIFPSQLPVEKFSHPLTVFKQDTECAFCRAISFYVEKDLNGDISKEGVQKALNEVCDKWVTDFPQHCKNFLSKYSENFEHAVVKGVKLEDVCTFLKACIADDTQSELRVKVLSKVKDGPFCDLCKETMTEVENTLSDPATKEKLENLADQGCNILPQSLRDDCTSFIKSNVDALIDMLQQELQPDTVCPALRLCDKKSKLEVAARVKDLECDLCKDVVSSLRKRMSDPAEKQTVLNFLEDGCARLPASLAGECKKFVDENIDTVIGMIIEQLDPNSVCGILRICPASLKKEKTKFKDIECDLCKEVIGKVEDMVKDQKTEAEIKSALDKVCSYLPSSLSAKCQNFVNQYTDLVISLLMQEMDPDMVCAALNLCPTTVQYPVWQSKAVDLECQGCQYALHYLQEQLTSADTQDEIKNLLKKMCDVLPETYAKNCEAFVNEYGSSLLVLISQEIDPSTTCYELQLCSNQTKLFENQNILHPFNIDECSICTTVVDYMDKLLEEDDVDKEITALVEKVCPVLPSSFVQKCSTMIETYGPYILQMIGQVADSKQVCQEIDMCSRPAGHVHLLGGNKCTFGPSYWCRSSAHASACKAEIYCREKVWINEIP